MDYKKLWTELMEFFTNTTQTNWRYTQIIDRMVKDELKEARNEGKDSDDDIPL